jgi:hypothetical protein
MNFSAATHCSSKRSVYRHIICIMKSKMKLISCKTTLYILSFANDYKLYKQYYLLQPVPVTSWSKVHMSRTIQTVIVAESCLRHGCISAFFCVVLSCVGLGLAMGWSPVQGVLPKWLNGFIVSEVNSQPEQTRELNPWNKQLLVALGIILYLTTNKYYHTQSLFWK